MQNPVVGFVGLGRLGLPVAELLLEAGHPLVCCRRGRSQDLVAKGATIPGDGSTRAVAEAADVLFSCLPGDVVEWVLGGEDGVLASGGPLPIVVELSTAPIPVKEALRAQLVERGGDLLDCPMSGTPAMAAARIAVVYASGDRTAYDSVAALLRVISPGVEYVGDLGTGTRMKYVANLLVLAHVAATAEAMAFATALGLDLDSVVKLISRSPAAASGQFNVRGPMIAAGEFDGKLVEIRDVRENLEQVTAAAREVAVNVPLTSTAKVLFDELGDRGEDGSDPGKLALFLDQLPTVSAAAESEATSGPAEPKPHERLYVGLSRVNAESWPPPPDVIQEHLRWVEGLERDGSLFLSGPFVDDAGVIAGDGLFVVRAASVGAAAELVAADPFSARGFRTVDVHGWELHQGALSISLNLSDGSHSLS